MSKAEEKAIAYCCTNCENNKRNCGMKQMSNGRNCVKCNNYIDGYHQAEKDLDISWVKEVSGEKEMKRAKEEALKAYPPRSIAANYDTISRRDAFEFGYLKAEKDLELTWRDMKEIVKIANLLETEWLNSTPWDGIRDWGFYKEVLKRFNGKRKK